jgi:hypothetical protein
MSYAPQEVKGSDDAVRLQPEVCCYRMRRKGDHYRWLCIWKETVVNIQKYHLNFIVLRDWGNKILYQSGYLTFRHGNEFNITQMRVSVNKHRR